jgi:uncharacterized protein YbjT (DUF2867 family)
VKVLIAGATGFIGSRLANALAAAGHEVVCASRHGDELPPGCARHARLDYSALPGSLELQRMVSGCEVVINAVGILRSRGSQTFGALHEAGPRALFAACSAAGVRRVIQISALGAEPGALSGYHRSKHAADRFLMDLPLDWVVVQPSLVYGAGGSSAGLFDMLATMPVIPLPAGGNQRVQPVHVDDVVAAVRKLAESPAPLRFVLPVAGPEPMALKEFLGDLRSALGKPRTLMITVPHTLMRFGAAIGNYLPGAMLDSETYAMLGRGSVANATPFTQWLGRPPRPVARFVPAAERDAHRVSAALSWLAPLLRIGVATMWLIAAIVSMGLYPVDDSLRLLRDIGVTPALAPILLMGAIAIDLAFGILTLLPKRHRWLWTAQIAVVITYTLIISWRLPELWLEPFGPVAKNLPILVMLLLLQQFERRR